MGNEDLTEEPKKPKRKAEPPPMQYVALVGLNYGCTDDDPAGTRLEAGADVPAEVIATSPWLLEQSLVKVKEAESV